MSHIAVIGGGWLGRPLAQYLESIGHQVSVSRTSKAGADELKAAHLDGFICQLESPQSEVERSLSAIQPSIVIGCFPPGFRKGKGDEYAEQWKKLATACVNIGVNKLVMVSSTTVYPSVAKEMYEDDATLALANTHSTFSDNAKIMLRAEQHVQDSGLRFAIVRCSGLIGPERHPSRFAAKLRQVSRLAPANMIHLLDAIGAVSFAALHDNNMVVNATTPNTVSKAQFYQTALERAGLSEPLPPIVDVEDKRIMADRLLELGYRFHFQHTLEAL